jgi:predicted Zn-dependent protease
VQPFPVAVVPVGRLDAAEISAAAARAAKVLREPLELREALPVPHGTEDPGRGQHRASSFLEQLGREVRKLRPGRLVLGEGEVTGSPPPRPDAFVFVTDVDLYTANTEGVFAALVRAQNAAVISLRRLREAFHRRRADPNRQRARLVKEILRMAIRLRGLPECTDPACVLAPSRTLPDLDLKDERPCRACEQRLFEGRVQI